ncbi:Hypothetical protein FKW44_018894, partial [Caligus rogercresseyi]
MPWGGRGDFHFFYLSQNDPSIKWRYYSRRIWSIINPHKLAGVHSLHTRSLRDEHLNTEGLLRLKNVQWALWFQDSSEEAKFYAPSQGVLKT